MSELPPVAVLLRERFRAIPREARQANQPFSIRVWRGLSWLERSEKADDPEGRLISLWIAFNSIYGYLEDDGRDARDHASWQTFLARLVRQDAGDSLGRIIREHQRDILKLVDNKFLFRPFWLGQLEADDKLHQAVRRCLKRYNDGCTLAILQELFERLYVLRMQVFHGAAICAKWPCWPAVSPQRSAWTWKPPWSAGFLHDCGRMNDDGGRQHALDSAEIARPLLAECFPHLDPGRICGAIERHADGNVTDDPLMGAVWDADRLTLTRLGHEIREELLSTPAGKRLARQRDGNQDSR